MAGEAEFVFVTASGQYFFLEGKGLSSCYDAGGWMGRLCFYGLCFDLRYGKRAEIFWERERCIIIQKREMFRKNKFCLAGGGICVIIYVLRASCCIFRHKFAQL